MTPLVPESSGASETWPLFLGLGFATVLILLVLVWAISEILLYLTPAEALPEKAFRRLYKISHQISLPLEPGDTPFEIAKKLNRYLTILGERSRWSDWALTNQIAVDQITDIYVGQLFSPSNKKHFDKMGFIRTYKKLRRMLWILWILTKLYRFKFLRSLLGSNVRRYVTEIRGGWI